MRPVKLVMEGFGTYRDRTEVDFDGVDLFALTGPTGSGKSTVVDAICMALYGSIPRYDDERLVGPAISTGLNEALVHLDFVVDGVPYTAVRIIRRTKGGGGTTKEARLESNGIVIAGSPKELTQQVTELLGLTFEHFTRCVVLPQGQFAKFLHDKPRDRQELLKQLLDITVYGRVANAARLRAQAAEREVALATARLGDLESVTPELRAQQAGRVTVLDGLYLAVQASEAELKVLEGEITAAQTSAATAEKSAASLREISVPEPVTALADALLRNAEGLATADAAESESAKNLQAREGALTELGDDGALQRARGLHDQLAELADATPERRATLEARVANLTRVSKELQTEESDIVVLTAEVTAKHDGAVTARDTAATLTALEIPEDVVGLSSELERVAGELTEAVAGVAAAAAAIGTAETQVVALGVPAELSATRAALVKRDALVGQHTTAEVDRAAKETALAGAQAAEERARSEHEVNVAAVAAATRAHQAHALRPGLVIGEACPVCDQTVKTLPTSHVPEALAAAEAAVKESSKKVSLAQTAKNECDQAFQRAEILVESLGLQIAELEPLTAGQPSVETIDEQLAKIAGAAEGLLEAKQLEKAIQERAIQVRAEQLSLQKVEAANRTELLQVHAGLGQFGAPALIGAAVLPDWQSVVEWAHATAPIQAEQAAKLSDEAATATAALDAHRASIRDIADGAGVAVPPGQEASVAAFGEARSTQEQVEQVGRDLELIARLRTQLDAFAAEHPLGDASLEAIEARIARIAEARHALQEAKDLHGAAATRIKELRAEREQLGADEASARTSFHATHAQLAALEPPAPVGQDVRNDWEALASWAQDLAPALADQALVFSNRVAEITGQLEGRERDIRKRCELLDVSLQAGQRASEATFAAKQSAQASVERTDQDLERAEKLRASVVANEAEEAVASELARLLKADNFEKWLLDDVLTQLVNGATATLMELSGDQFSLAYDDGDFLVIDHRNADQTRQAKTLSGGETFLASLSLALSLAEQLAAFAGGRAVKLDALFLDEGFGTLDADTLDVVASAIEELGSRGRMVGLISHVAELAERVPVRFEVQKVANASTIQRVLQ